MVRAPFSKAMSKFRRSGSITRFFVEGERADVADLSLIRALERERFKPLDNSATETDSMGWITRHDPAGARFDPEDVIHGHFLVFALRMDKKRVSPALLKIQIAGDLRAAATGLAQGKKMPRAQKKQIVEEAKRKLISRALPNVAITDVVWNCKKSELYIFATGASTVEQIAHIFRDTFKRDLLNATISNIVDRYKLNETQKRALKELSPAQIAQNARGEAGSAQRSQYQESELEA